MERGAGTVLMVSAEGIDPDTFADGEFDVRFVQGGYAGLRVAAEENPQVIVADSPLGDIPVLDFIKGIREWTWTPIIAVSTNPSPDAKVAVLNAGADDYVVKPYGLDEFRARVRVAFRHKRQLEPGFGPVLKMGATTVDLSAHTITRNGEPIHMAPIEFQLLAELVRNPGRVVTQRHLLMKVWSHASRSNLPVLRAYIAILRRKLSRYPDGDVVIETIPGIGYRLYHSWSD